jgi:hypothetical protein
MLIATSSDRSLSPVARHATPCDPLRPAFCPSALGAPHPPDRHQNRFHPGFSPPRHSPPRRDSPRADSPAALFFTCNRRVALHSPAPRRHLSCLLAHQSASSLATKLENLIRSNFYGFTRAPTWGRSLIRRTRMPPVFMRFHNKLFSNSFKFSRGLPPSLGEVVFTKGARSVRHTFWDRSPNPSRSESHISYSPNPFSRPLNALKPQVFFCIGQEHNPFNLALTEPLQPRLTLQLHL